jgi:hypothetical protein
MEPRADGLAVLDCVRAPGKGQERILEGVLGVVPLAEDRAANREDHRTVTLDQDPESVRVICGDETFQKLLLGHCSTLRGPSIPIGPPP